MTESSRMPLFDLRKLNASLPVPSVPSSSIEVLVLGANDDFIVVIILLGIHIHSWSTTSFSPYCLSMSDIVGSISHPFISFSSHSFSF